MRGAESSAGSHYMFYPDHKLIMRPGSYLNSTRKSKSECIMRNKFAKTRRDTLWNPKTQRKQQRLCLVGRAAIPTPNDTVPGSTENPGAPPLSLIYYSYKRLYLSIYVGEISEMKFVGLLVCFDSQLIMLDAITRLPHLSCNERFSEKKFVTKKIKMSSRTYVYL